LIRTDFKPIQLTTRHASDGRDKVAPVELGKAGELLLVTGAQDSRFVAEGVGVEYGTSTRGRVCLRKIFRLDSATCLGTLRERGSKRRVLSFDLVGYRDYRRRNNNGDNCEGEKDAGDKDTGTTTETRTRRGRELTAQAETSRRGEYGSRAESSKRHWGQGSKYPLGTL